MPTTDGMLIVTMGKYGHERLEPRHVRCGMGPGESIRETNIDRLLPDRRRFKNDAAYRNTVNMLFKCTRCGEPVVSP